MGWIRKRAPLRRGVMSWRCCMPRELTHAIGLNDVCDGLEHHRGLLGGIRGAVPPSRNGFSYANKHRDAKMAEELFWEQLGYLQGLSKGFGIGKAP